jgi:antitoxin CptB
MKELDLVLSGWLERHYATASSAERNCFDRFLDLPDPELAAYLLGREIPTDPGFAALVAQLAGHRH